jgi:hypothetical protein
MIGSRVSTACTSHDNYMNIHVTTVGRGGIQGNRAGEAPAAGGAL